MSANLGDELERLARLHDSGQLSDDEFARAKALVLSDARRAPAPPDGSPAHELRRSTTDRWLGGVCGGLARATGIDAWVVRLVFAALFLFWGSGLLLYLLLWIFVPQD